MAVPVRGRGSFADTDLDHSLFSVISGSLSPVFRPLGFDSWEAGGALMTGFVAKEVVVSTMSQTYGIDEPDDAPSVPTTFGEDLAEIGTSFGSALLDTLKSVPLIVGVNLFEEQEEDSTALMHVIRRNFETTSGGHGELAGLAFMVFVLLYTPCMVALAAERQELGVKWMWVSIFGQLILAWLVAFVVFQGGKLLGLG
jgi:ferrous iron transport protein B